MTPGLRRRCEAFLEKVAIVDAAGEHGILMWSPRTSSLAAAGHPHAGRVPRPRVVAWGENELPREPRLVPLEGCSPHHLRGIAAYLDNRGVPKDLGSRNCISPLLNTVELIAAPATAAQFEVMNKSTGASELTYITAPCLLDGGHSEVLRLHESVLAPACS